MKSDNNQYIAEVDLKSIGKGLGTGLLAGSALFGGIVTAGKMAGIGRFASRPTETNVQPIQPSVQPPIQQSIQQTPTIINQSKPKAEIKQNTQIKQTSPKVEEVKQHEFQNEHIKRLYGAVVHAEHRGHVTDPYAYNKNLSIRTKSGGGASSSYGPLQMNTSVSGFLATTTELVVTSIRLYSTPDVIPLTDSFPVTNDPVISAT